ncbi:MAG: beta-ketoacyl-[acyl-carrier-protein] synthase family protein [Proteobacteria bacterium]|jgi:3-oxoacyl-[acyl-carrier-protein] synthase II|nr:beta-ketoacyl-[acyl-carrier-protein] synthase family protein [Pseudomonadota bacterium]
MRAPENNRVVVVGTEVSTSLGHGLEKTWRRAVNGESGIRWLTRFDAGDYPAKAVGEIPDYDPLAYEFLSERDVYFWDAKFIPLTMALCHDVAKKTGLVIDASNAHRVGALIGSAINGNDSYEQNLEGIREGGALKVSPFCLPNICANMPAGKASILLGFTGPVMAPATACATANHCIAEAAEIIQRGDADVMFAGGAEMPLLPAILYGFGNMRALLMSEKGDRSLENPAAASRPYSGDRRGFVLAEGAGIVLLASLAYAERRGLPILAEVIGQHMNSDAYHYTNPKVETITACVRGAIEDAGVAVDEVGYINGHGTSTKVGDKTEIACLRTVFGDALRKIPISSNKSQFGHSLAASAALEAAMTVRGLVEGIILPTLNLRVDPDFADLDLVPETARRAPHDIAISTSFGFGGPNCCVVFKRFGA